MNQVDKTKIKNTSYRNYREHEMFTLGGVDQFPVLDFWRFYYGNIAWHSDNLAEYLVARSLGIEQAENVTYWTAYDMSYRGKRIEVKFTEYVHSWNKERVSKKRSFSIKPSHNAYWDEMAEGGLSRQNDLYVFCVKTSQDLQNTRPLVLDDWEFYVAATADINKYAEGNGNPNQKTISLGAVKRIVGDPVKYDKLKEKVDAVIDCCDLGL